MNIFRRLFFKRIGESDPNAHFVRPMMLAVFVGAGTGILVVGFVQSIVWLQNVLYHPGISRTLWVILIPVAGGLIIGPWITFMAPEAAGHGIPEVLKAVALRGSKIKPVVGLVKVGASIISISSGFSVGREGPIVQVGSALGSWVGQLLRLPEARLRNLLACGAAAGIAGVFNTPIAGVMFASEVILRDFGANSLSTVVVAAVSSSIVSRIFLGDHPSFVVPSYELYHPLEIFLYFGLGILAALIAVVFMTVLEWFEFRSEDWMFPVWLKPACAGFVIGCTGYFFPQILGSGLPAIQDALHGYLPLNLLLCLIVVKILATSISLGGGSSGGVFAPLLFIGAVTGGAFGQMANEHYLFAIAPSGAYALVGMASVFAAAARAPITSILIVFELTGSYGMILPIMIGVVTATSISQIIRKDSIYLGKLKRKGIDVKSLEEVRLLEGLKVDEVMKRSFCVVSEEAPIQEVMQLMSEDASRHIFTADRNKALTGIIKPADFNKVLLSPDHDFLIADDLAGAIKEYSFPDEPLGEAARLMAANHLTEMPVVDAFDVTKVVGVLRSEDIFQAYAESVCRRGDFTSVQAHADVLPADVKTVVFTITPRSPIAGRPIKEIDLPTGVHFNLVRRGDRYSVPHGNMTMNVKDRVTAIVMPDQEPAFRQWLRDKKLKD